ncbi:hypothetical protein ACFW1A_40075, partial [Kitasatospora sp. NPDC058965]
PTGTATPTAPPTSAAPSPTATSSSHLPDTGTTVSPRRLAALAVGLVGTGTVTLLLAYRRRTPRH